MIKCESLRINMYRITHTGKSVNFPVTLDEPHSCKNTSVCYKKTMLNIDWHDILPFLYFDEFFHDS